MDNWSDIQKALDSIGRDKKWLAARLGIERMQTVDHFARRGVPAKYQAAISALFEKPVEKIDLSPNALTLARWFDRLPECEEKMRVFTRLMIGVTESIDLCVESSKRSLAATDGKSSEESPSQLVRDKTA